MNAALLTRMLTRALLLSSLALLWTGGFASFSATPALAQWVTTGSASVGAGPSDMLLSQDKQRLYVLNMDRSQSFSTISVLNPTTDPPTPLDTITLPGKGVGMAVTPDRSRAYVAAHNLLTVIDLNFPTNPPLSLDLGCCDLVYPVVNAAGTRLYIPDVTADRIVVVDVEPTSPTYHQAIATVALGTFNTAYPYNLGLTPDQSRLYVSTGGTRSVRVIDTATNQILPGSSPIPVSVTGPPGGGAGYAALAISPDGRRAYMAQLVNDTRISVINTEPGSPGYNTEIDVIETGAATDPFGQALLDLAVSVDGAHLLAAAFASNALLVIDIREGTPNYKNVVSVGPIPDAYAVVSRGSPNAFAYVASGTDTGEPTNVWVVREPVSRPLVAFLHASGSALFLDADAPTAATPTFKDSPGLSFASGNPWREVGTWSATPGIAQGALDTLASAQVWIGLKNSDDVGTRFDLRAEVLKNGTLVASSDTLCITGVTRNANQAQLVNGSFQAFEPADFNGTTDILSLRVLARIGTDGTGGPCGGHSSAAGLRLYFDSVSRLSRVEGSFAD